MPGFDGTGPRGQGPMTGRGEGYCAVQLPGSGRPAYGYTGAQGSPVRFNAPSARPAPGARAPRRRFSTAARGRTVGRGHGRGRGGGRGGGRRGRGRW